MIGTANEICLKQSSIKKKISFGRNEPGILDLKQADNFVKAYMVLLELDQTFTEIVERNEDDFEREVEDVNVSVFQAIAKAFNF